MNKSAEEIVTEAALNVRSALTQLGLTYRLHNGALHEVSFKSIEVVGDAYGLLEVDTQRLPRKVHIEQLTNAKTLHHLTATVGYPVRRLNTTGLTYCVVIKPSEGAKLPATVPLDLATRPAHLAIPIGRATTGDIWQELAATGHILVGGSTRAGKSTWLNTLLVSILMGRSPRQVQLALIDPKGVEFTPWRHAPHLIAPVASEPDDATRVLEIVHEEVRRREALFVAASVRNLPTYNQTTSEKLPWLIVVIDEFTDLALLAGLRSQFYRDLTRLVSKGAAFGVVAVLATQNPKAEVINTLIRGNLTTRLAFRCAEAAQSRVILDCAGAEKLPAAPGRALAKFGGRMVEVQAFFVPNDEVAVLSQAICGGPLPQSMISETERRLVRYALAQLAGAFTIGKLAAAFDGEQSADGGPRISRWATQKAGERLAEQGLLTKPTHATDPRWVTENLAALVGNGL